MNAPHIAQTGVMSLVLQSGMMAKMVLLLLLAASIYSWAVIWVKNRTLSKARKENSKFLEIFWNSRSIEDIFVKAEKFVASPVANVFKSGFKELKKVSGPEYKSLEDQGIENVTRALVRASTFEVAALEKQVSWLATIASAAPFVGLFGTVWGIMNSFQNIGATGTANLAIVAPGISEALITTATGIAAAVPAVIAYNFFVGQIKRQAVDMDVFSQDFLNIIQRGVAGIRKGT
ncbi:protein TolQ [bacterium]|jgi:biopolymer transport protein TolQ|nr:protein TolQ [bacterium]